MKKRILVISTGGTICGKTAKKKFLNGQSFNEKTIPSFVENSLKPLRESTNVEIETTVVDLLNIDSSNIQPEHWTALVEKIQERYDDFDSFIILHGTNTMGYTAAALSFAFENIGKPVIFTGAQIPLGYLGSDAEVNLINALRLAVWEYHPIKGVMAVFGSKIISGVRLKKGTDFDYDSFKSFQVSTLGEVGRFLKIKESVLRKHLSYLSQKKPMATCAKELSVQKWFNTKDIALLIEFPGMSADIFQTLVEKQNARAIVLWSFGAGDPSSHLFPAFEYLKRKKIPIVVSTQAPGGTANFQVNEGGKYLKDHDLAIPAYDMSGESMITKLSWLLAQDLSYEEIQKKMLEDLHGEINVEDELA